MLFLLFCKIAEPLISVIQFEQTTDGNALIINDDFFEVKAYFAIPYHNANSVETELESNTYQHEGQFYSIIEKRFANDTLYLKLQNNLSARERFASLTEVVNEMSLSKNSVNKDIPAKKSTAINLEDLSKVFLPTFAPEIIKFNDFYSINFSPKKNWKDISFQNSAYLSIFSPPPQDC